MTWQVREHKGVRKIIESAAPAVRQKYDLWVETVRAGGPQALRATPGFHDEALKGAAAGLRSSRLNNRYRVIYEVHGQLLVVDVIKVTGQHDY
jgi:plasmid maintenance system killer protein